MSNELGKPVAHRAPRNAEDAGDLRTASASSYAKNCSPAAPPAGTSWHSSPCIQTRVRPRARSRPTDGARVDLTHIGVNEVPRTSVHAPRSLPHRPTLGSSMRIVMDNRLRDRARAVRRVYAAAEADRSTGKRQCLARDARSDARVRAPGIQDGKLPNFRHDQRHPAARRRPLRGLITSNVLRGMQCVDDKRVLSGPCPMSGRISDSCPVAGRFWRSGRVITHS